MDPLQAETLELERTEEGGCDRHRMDDGADVVQETREGQLLGARTATRGIVAFHHEGGEPGTGERDGRGQPVGTGAHDHNVVARPCRGRPRVSHAGSGR